jgi:hypothetical protein
MSSTASIPKAAGAPEVSAVRGRRHKNLDRSRYHSTAMSEKHVLASIQFWRPLEIVLGMQVYLLFAVVVFCGIWSPVRMAVWSVAALLYAGYIYLKGWTPWRMPTYQILEGNLFDPADYTPIQEAVWNFLHERRVRTRAALLTSTAVLTPWLVSAVTVSLQLKPIGHNSPEALPVIAYVIGGLGDGIRAGTLAMRYMTGEVLRNWDHLRAEAADQEVTGQGSGAAPIEVENEAYASNGSLRDLLRRRGISARKFIFWLAVLFGLLLLYVRAKHWLFGGLLR